MKFKILGIEITIRKEYVLIGILMLILILALWGWYLKTNGFEVFDADDKQSVRQIKTETGDGENTEKPVDNGRNTEVSEEPQFININTADINALMKLHGIGKVKAKAIIDYREQNGPFRSIEEIMNVKGIGEATFSRIKDRIIVGTEESNNTELLK